MAKITYSHFNGDHKPGDTVEVSDDEARAAVRAGVALYSTVKDAEASGGDKTDAATTRSKQ